MHWTLALQGPQLHTTLLGSSHSMRKSSGRIVLFLQSREHNNLVAVQQQFLRGHNSLLRS